MKQAILTLLSSLIISLKQESTRYHSLILPLIQGSVHPESVCPALSHNPFHSSGLPISDSISNLGNIRVSFG